MVHWIRFHLPMQGVKGSIPGGGAKIPCTLLPKNQRSSTVTNSIKTSKIFHIKKKKNLKKKNKLAIRYLNKIVI